MAKIEELLNVNENTGINEYISMPQEHSTSGETPWKISVDIHHLVNDNREKILEDYSHIDEDEEFFILLIKNIFLHLNNKTDLLNRLDITQLKKIPPIIYNVAKNTFSVQRIVYKEKDFLKKINNLYGFIYLSTNQAIESKKVYVGQTTRTIYMEWANILSDAGTLKRKRENNQKIHPRYKRYILYAVVKYGSEVWELKLIDIAYNQFELDNKEIYNIVDIYDSINRDNGYNLTKGGMGGVPTQEVREKMSKSQIERWDIEERNKLSETLKKKYEEDPSYREKISKVKKEMWQDEKRREKASERMTEWWQDGEYRGKMTEMTREWWQDEKHREQESQRAKEMWQDEEYQRKYSEARKKKISDIREFLINIKNADQKQLKLTDLCKKYKIKSEETFKKRIREILEPFGIENFLEAKEFLIDKDIEEVLEYIDPENEMNPSRREALRCEWLNTEFLEMLKEMRKTSRFRAIEDLEGFLTNVKNIKKKDISEKYDLHMDTILNKIKKILKPFNLKDFREAKTFLKDKDIKEIIKHIDTKWHKEF